MTGSGKGVSVVEQWYEKRTRFKVDKAVVKLVNEDGSFKKSIVVPTDYYPLNGKYEVFTYANTKQTLDDGVLEIFDKVKYRIGGCYTNTTELVARLQKRGYDVKSYVGWAFLTESDFPVHHCWAVLNGETILDLSDDYTMMLTGENGEYFTEGQSKEERRELIVSFQLAASKVPNRVRCYPVGRATPFMLYIGCECSPDEGRKIYNNLIRKYPGHECERNCDASGLNATQKAMREAGLNV